LDILVVHASQEHDGLNERWFAGHRNGETGLSKPHTHDIERYREAVHWIQDRINANPNYLTDDTRFWVNVRAT
jgi:hypothetical protein